MKCQRTVLTLLLLSILTLTACSPGHIGSNVLAFIRDGQLWTIDPDGANAFAVVNQGSPVVGYSWSPTHQILAYRTLDDDFAKTAAAKQFINSSRTGIITDVPSTLNTIGIDGGTPIPIAFSRSDVQYNNPIWNGKGTRLLYRQTQVPPAGKQTPVSSSSSGSPLSTAWWISQNDQPGGIALKGLPISYSIPSLSYLPTHYLAIGNSDHGVFTTTLAGAELRVLSSEALPGHPLPATLERVLWQPAHKDQSFLYAAASETALDTLTVQLTLRNMNGQKKVLATCTCTQFAWSPDGNTVVYKDGSNYKLLDVSSGTSFAIAAEESSIPYWSPDSRFLLLDGEHTLRIVQRDNKQQQALLNDGKGQEDTSIHSEKLSSPNALLQPMPNSPWSADSTHFLFLSHSRLNWQGKALREGNGLYTIKLDEKGVFHEQPTLVHRGNDSQAGWTYQDANTSFLY